MSTSSFNKKLRNFEFRKKYEFFLQNVHAFNQVAKLSKFECNHKNV